MRTLLGCTLGLVLCCGLSADDKKDDPIDAKKLVGKWSPKEAAVFTIELTKDGKATIVTITSDGKGMKGEGTYKVDGNKLTAKVKMGDEDMTRSFTISKLTDTEMVATSDKGKETTLVRLKDK